MRLIIFILGISILASCTVQKRRYQQGYYVHHHKGIKPAEQKKTITNADKEHDVSEIKVRSAGQVQDLLTAGADQELLTSIRKQNHQLGPDTCDKLLFRDGSEIDARVTEVSLNEIKYHRCEAKEGPAYVTRKSDLFMIKYADGRKEIMPTEVAPSAPSNQAPGDQRTYNQKPSYNGVPILEPHANSAFAMGALSFLLLVVSGFTGLLGLLFFVTSVVLAILAIKNAKITKRNMEAEPGKYRGRSNAIAGKVFAIITLSLIGLTVLILILFLLLLMLI